MITLGPKNRTGPQGPAGQQGPQGSVGPSGPAPEHEWDGTKLRFKNPNGSWGPWIDLKGPKGEKGKDGKRGPPGRDGISHAGSSQVILKIASENISAIRCVYLVSDEQVALSDFQTSGKQRVIGIAKSAALAGEQIQIVTSGILQDPLFSSFNLNQAIFLGSNGQLTQTRPNTGVMIEVGYYIGNNEIKIEIHRPIKRIGV